jgi:hypothetical protein
MADVGARHALRQAKNNIKDKDAVNTRFIYFILPYCLRLQADKGCGYFS